MNDGIKSILRPFYKMIKYLRFKILDYFDLFRGKKNPLIPPRNLIFIGDGDYEKTGNEFFNYFTKLANLKPDAKVLDIGCGTGRMALPLTRYLSSHGEYHGLDIVKKGIDWCQKNITPLYPNFHFQHSNVFNKMYNPKGTEKSNTYQFAFPDSYFDFIFLTSVFTHMHSEDMIHYLSEISRVLKVNGRCLFTYFLINNESKELIQKEKSTQNLKYQINENSFTLDLNVPERALGFDENFILTSLHKYSLKLLMPIQYGSWCGQAKSLSYQDIVICERV